MNIRLAAPSVSSIYSTPMVSVQNLHAKPFPNVFKIPENNDFATSFFDEMLADPFVGIFIAEDDGNPEGYVVCRLIKRPETPLHLRRLHCSLLRFRSIPPPVKKRWAVP